MKGAMNAHVARTAEKTFLRRQRYVRHRCIEVLPKAGISLDRAAGARSSTRRARRCRAVLVSSSSQKAPPSAFRIVQDARPDGGDRLETSSVLMGRPGVVVVMRIRAAR